MHNTLPMAGRRIYGTRHLLMDGGGDLVFSFWVTIQLALYSLEVGRFALWETEPIGTFSATKTILPGLTTKYYALSVPGKTPIKPGYTFKGKIIVPPGSGEVISEDSFEFEVKPAMESLPLGFGLME
jgi:hypothetical protein